MRSNRIDETIDDFCEKLTNEMKVCQNTKCDSESKYRTIEGCCNNLKNSDLGNFYDKLDLTLQEGASGTDIEQGRGAIKAPPPL